VIAGASDPSVLTPAALQRLSLENYILNFAVDKKGYKVVQYWTPERQGQLLEELAALTLAALPRNANFTPKYVPPTGKTACADLAALAAKSGFDLGLHCPPA
jgi:hypothetical protein